MAGGTQDNGTVQFQGSLGWYELVGGDGGDVVFDPNPQAIVLYAEVEWYFDQGGERLLVLPVSADVGCLSRNTGIDLTGERPVHPAHGARHVESVDAVADGREAVPHRQSR